MAHMWGKFSRRPAVVAGFVTGSNMADLHHYHDKLYNDKKSLQIPVNVWKTFRILYKFPARIEEKLNQ